MSNEMLNLDWRSSPSTEQILLRIHRLLGELDKAGAATMVLSGSMTGKPGAELGYVDAHGVLVDEPSDSTRRMFVFRTKTTRKRAAEYLLRLLVVTKRILQDIDKMVPVASRLFGYYWTHSQISRAAAFSSAMDLALTIGVHPYALGIIPEIGGRIMIPRDWNIEFTVCNNIFAYIDKRPNSTTLRRAKGPTMDIVIPSLVVSLRLQRQKNTFGVPRAVIVLEHKNMKYLLQSLVERGDTRFSGMFFLATGGFSDRGTREFLRLLTTDPLMKGVPCVFISDRDPHAMEIFSNIKYGSRQCAFESAITAVNQIQWGGVSIARYLQLAKDWPDRSLKDWIRLNPESSQEDRDTVLKRIQRATNRCMIDTLKQPSALLNKSDKARIQHFHKIGIFSRAHDPDLYADLIAMGMNPLGSRFAVNPNAVGQKFGLAKLSQLNIHGIEECMAAVMEECGVLSQEDILAQSLNVSLARQAWIAAGSNVDPAILRESSVTAVQTGSETCTNALRSEAVPSETDHQAIASTPAITTSAGATATQAARA